MDAVHGVPAIVAGEVAHQDDAHIMILVMIASLLGVNTHLGACFRVGPTSGKGIAFPRSASVRGVFELDPRRKGQAVALFDAIEIENLGLAVRIPTPTRRSQGVSPAAVARDDVQHGCAAPRIPILGIARLQVAVQKELVGIAAHLRKRDAVEYVILIIGGAFHLEERARRVLQTNDAVEQVPSVGLIGTRHVSLVMHLGIEQVLLRRGVAVLTTVHGDDGGLVPVPVRVGVDVLDDAVQIVLLGDFHVGFEFVVIPLLEIEAAAIDILSRSGPVILTIGGTN
mmetsp:Transcript_6647/g.16378  ORF Transcript_6647/g.16378 Transcript_6647/m.16378 type:complete len:283 (-) Transcript_6647:506-1354(-)